MDNPALFASSFDTDLHPGRYMAEEFAEELGKMSGRCIDIGSGPGGALVNFILPKLDPKSTMVYSDISESMMNFAKTKYGGDDRLSFTTLNITTRDLPSDLVGQFDYVTSFLCLNWCGDIRQAFENIFTLLRPGGTVFLNFVSNSPFYDAWIDLAAMPRYQSYMKDKSRFTSEFHYDKRPTETLRKMVKEIGFDIGHLSERQMNTIFNNQDTVKDLVVSVNPFIGRMPDDLRKEYAEDLFKALISQDNVFQKYNSKNEFITLWAWKTLLVHLKKPSSS